MASKNAGLGMTYQEPALLVEPIVPKDIRGEHAFVVEDVPENETIYEEICIDFENAGIKVVKIEKLKNLHLWKRYVTERDLLIEQRDPNFKLNEKYLYHGTSAERSLICEEGLDSRMSKQGCFGRGIYFSDYPRKCVKYAERGRHEESFILLTRVILGQSKVYPKQKKDKDLVREPEKELPYTGYKFYDSVEGCPVNHKEFVVYESRRVLVEGIITYVLPKQHSNNSATTVESRRPVSPSVDTDTESSEDELRDEGSTVLPEFSETSSSDDDDDGTASHGMARVGQRKKESAKAESSESLLRSKKDEFRRRAGVPVADHIIEHCLLKADLNVTEAIKVFKDTPKGEPHTEEVSDTRWVEELYEEMKPPSKPDPPAFNSPEWRQMSASDKEAVIQGLIENFLHVTGLEETDVEYARKCLASTNYNLDFAIIAHYEEMASNPGDI